MLCGNFYRVHCFLSDEVRHWLGGGCLSNCVGLCIVFLLMVLSRFDCLCGSVECVLVHSPSEVGMVTPSEGCVNGISAGGVGSTGIIPGVLSLMTC